MKKINLLLVFIFLLAHGAFSQKIKDQPLEPIDMVINCHITMNANYPSSYYHFIIPDGYGVDSSYEIGQTICISAELENNSKSCVIYTLNYEDWVFMGKPDTQISTINAYKWEGYSRYVYQTFNVVININ